MSGNVIKGQAHVAVPTEGSHGTQPAEMPVTCGCFFRDVSRADFISIHLPPPLGSEGGQQ
jgi:hypothetical protein